MTHYVLLALIGFISSFCVLWLTAMLAVQIGYVDKPVGHKTHSFAVPPIGGVALYLVMLAGTVVAGFHEEDPYFLAALGLLAIVGAVDEYRHIAVRVRIVIEVMASLLMAFGAGIALTHFGNLLGFGTIYLPWFIGLACTIVAVFGTINAWNMIDGIDGLAASMAIMSMASFLVVTAGHETLPAAVFLLFGGLFAFLLFNFSSGKPLPKIFLGDAGSKLIGFSLVWFMIRDTQGTGLEFKPATALYVMGLPIMDMTSTVLSRLRQRLSPFAPDRSHLHHVLQAMGYKRADAYLLIVAIAACMHIVGIILHLSQVAGYIQFAIYFGSFIVYHVYMDRVRRRLNLHRDIDLQPLTKGTV